MQLELYGSLGDEVAMTGCVRAIRAHYPKEKIRISCRRPWLFDGNPHLRKVHPGRLDPPEPVEEEETLGTVVLPLGGNAHQHLVDAYLTACGIEPAPQYRQPELFLSIPEEVIGDLVSPGTIAIDTWAGWPSRRWPFYKWQEVVSRLRESFPIIEVGATTSDCFGKSRPDILRDVDACYVDTFSVRHTAGLLKGCALYLGQDSGLMHVAAAVGTPQVIVFGPKGHSLRAYANTYPVNPSRGCSCEEVCLSQRAPCPIDVSVEQVIEEVCQRVSQA